MFRQALLCAISLALASAQDVQCHDYVLVSTRGTYEVQGSSIGFYGMINSTLRAISGGIEYDTVYPAAPNATSAPVGVVDVVRYINAGLQSCPKQSYALLGYSQGASVTDAALRNFTDQSSAAFKAIKAVLVIGNPGHKPGASANVDENGGDATRNATGPRYAGGAGAIPDVYYSADKVLDICYQGDSVCSPPPDGVINIVGPHLLYGSTESVQKQGADFLISKLGGTPSATSTSQATNSVAVSSTMGGPSNRPSSSQSTTAPAATFTGMAAAAWKANSAFVLGLAAAVIAV